jgi:ABC-type branched-subunit amino acid transport system permease subunit
MALWQLSFWEGMMLAVMLVGALSIVVGAICFRFRLREFYFAVVTLAFSEVARLVVLNWNSVTNGSLGITLQAKPTLWLPGQGVVKVDGTLMWYYLGAAALAVTLLVSWRIVHSWMGRCFAAIRLNDELGDTLGINVFRYKLAVFVIANVIAACTGGLYVFYLGFIEPGFLSIEQSLAIVAMVLLGGRGSVAAPEIGAVDRLRRDPDPHDSPDAARCLRRAREPAAPAGSHARATCCLKSTDSRSASAGSPPCPTFRSASVAAKSSACSVRTARARRRCST